MAAQYLPVTWRQYHSLAQKLAAAILSDKKPYDEIVAIARGGLTLGHLLSDFLRIPVSTITIQSYTDIQTQGNITITKKIQGSVKGKHVLLVDDVADSGKTIQRAVSYLRRLKPRQITTVTMFYKPRSVIRPDYIAAKTTRWILFPYEPTEMILLITKQITSEGKTKAAIQRFLQRLGYTADQIAFVRKYYDYNLRCTPVP